MHYHMRGNYYNDILHASFLFWDLPLFTIILLPFLCRLFILTQFPQDRTQDLGVLDDRLQQLEEQVARIEMRSIKNTESPHPHPPYDYQDAMSLEKYRPLLISL